MESTVQPRKCRQCGYFADHKLKKSKGWCYWLGKWRNANQDECEDGFTKEKKIP